MSFAQTVSARNRSKKWSIFTGEFDLQPQTKVLDVGFSENEYSSVDNYIEKHFPYPQSLTALGVDKPVEFPKRYPGVTAVQYDGVKFPFPDNSFDIVWSNAVIEHVGAADRQLTFLQEVRRVGRRGMITTPNRLFPIEVHTRTPFLHWLPKPVFDRYLSMVGKGWAAGDYMYLLNRSEFTGLVERAGIRNYRILENKLGGFTLDFILIF